MYSYVKSRFLIDYLLISQACPFYSLLLVPFCCCEEGEGGMWRYVFILLPCFCERNLIVFLSSVGGGGWRGMDL